MSLPPQGGGGSGSGSSEGGTTLRQIASGTTTAGAGPGEPTVLGPYTRLAGERIFFALYPAFDGRVSAGNDDPTEGVGAYLDNASAGEDEFNLVLFNNDAQAHVVDWTIFGHVPE